MEKLYSFLIENKQKAIVGFVVAAATAYFAKHGLDLETLTVKQALEMVVYGVLGYTAVWFKKNK